MKSFVCKTLHTAILHNTDFYSCFFIHESHIYSSNTITHWIKTQTYSSINHTAHHCIYVSSMHHRFIILHPSPHTMHHTSQTLLRHTTLILHNAVVHTSQRRCIITMMHHNYNTHFPQYISNSNHDNIDGSINAKNWRYISISNTHRRSACCRGPQ